MRSYYRLVLILAAALPTISCGSGGVATFQNPSSVISPSIPIGATIITGRVSNISNDQAIVGATLKLGTSTSTSDGNGVFSFGNVLPGSYTLSASAAGYLPRSYDVHAASDVTQNVQLATAGLLAGKITSAAGEAIPGATVQFSGGLLNETSTVSTDATGSYNTGWIAIGPYTLTISSTGFENNSATATVNNGNTSTANVVLLSNAPGPHDGWVVVTLPNPQVTPNWRSYAPADCQPDPTVCAHNSRFWEEFDFTNFRAAIDEAFVAIASQGRYRGVLTSMPLGDSPIYWSNIQLLFDSAAAHGLQFQPVLFPKWKWGNEWCYLYPSNAPSGCEIAPGTTTAVAYQELVKLMNFVQNLGGTCDSGTYSRRFAIWYGWSEFSPGYTALFNFWQSLPNTACQHRSAYVTWLDEPFMTNSDVSALRAHVIEDLQLPFWVTTEIYISNNLLQKHTLYAPYQMIVTGYPLATDVGAWAQGICGRWTSAGRPQRFGIWTFFDRDVSPIEQYRAYINGSMFDVSSMCSL